MTHGVAAERTEALKAIIGKKVTEASSSLTGFAIKFDDLTGVMFDAVQPTSPFVAAKVVDASQLPRLEEAVCTVDWTWISGATIEDAKDAGASVKLQFNPVGPLTIGSALWEGKPFLSFQPYKPAKK
ncbi:MAG: hypothetical protein K2X93_02615 [Candidatus Obscuribacterales bacterium]|nr:hypothetical protein [Candidatus Obscuribacterales bacterium]